jgi:uncharacterized membrane protein YjgN (DUF898 family)
MGPLAAAWGIAGVTALLATAIVRLAPVAAEALASSAMTGPHWAILSAWVGAMAYFEGYRGFQLAFSPRVAARARHLSHHPTAVRAVLAPLFCMAYFAAPARRRLASTGVTAAVVVLVLAMRHVPQPWRGIVDAGVVVGLAWGLVSLWVFTALAFGTTRFDHPAEVAPGA